MNAIKEVLHSSKQMVNAFRDYYPPAWSKDANKIIDEAAAELAALTAELEAVKRERDELKQANGLIKYHFDKWTDYHIEDEEFAEDVLSVFEALAKGEK